MNIRYLPNDFIYYMLERDMLALPKLTRSKQREQVSCAKELSHFRKDISLKEF
ncbi:MAG: hypothetical protein ACJA2C_002810 [Marinoscillum sp.]|jgi:hypothetical protein